MPRRTLLRPPSPAPCVDEPADLSQQDRVEWALGPSTQHYTELLRLLFEPTVSNTDHDPQR